MDVLVTAEKYADKIRTQYMFLLMRLHRILLLMKQGSTERAESLSDESDALVNQFADTAKNEFHGQHIKVHHLMLNMLAKLSVGKVRNQFLCNAIPHFAHYLLLQGILKVSSITDNFVALPITFVALPITLCNDCK